MLPKMPTPKTDRQREDGSEQFVDWAEKVKGDCISKAISHIVQEVAIGSQNGNDSSNFENGGTGDAKSSAARGNRSSKGRNSRLNESENRPPSSHKNYSNSEKGSFTKKH